MLGLIWSTVAALAAAPDAAWSAYRELYDPGAPPRPVAAIEADLHEACSARYAPACEDRRHLHPTGWDRATLAVAAAARCKRSDPLSCVVGDLADLAHTPGRAPLLEAGCLDGDRMICAVLYEHLRRGRGVSRAPERARAGLEQTCRDGKGPALACRGLGQAMWYGDGGARDRVGAERALAAACAADDAPACATLGWLHVEQGATAQAQPALARACAGGVEAACTAGSEATCDTPLVAACPAAPIPAWAERHAHDCAIGDPLACASLGMGRLAGMVSASDLTLAMQELDRACRTGSAVACYEVGRRTGWPAQPADGADLLRLACAHGYGPACAPAPADTCADGEPAACAALARTTGPDRLPEGWSDVRWSRVLDRSCAAGQADACRIAAEARRSGAAVPLDLGAALQGLARACSAGEAEACQQADALRRRLRGAEMVTPRQQPRLALIEAQPPQSPEAVAAIEVHLAAAEPCAADAIADSPAGRGIITLGVEADRLRVLHASTADASVIECVAQAVQGPLRAGQVTSVRVASDLGAARALSPPASVDGVADSAGLVLTATVSTGRHADQPRLAAGAAASLELRSAAMTCLGPLLSRGQWPQGRITLRYAWAPDGSRSEVRVAEDDSEAEGLGACLAKQVLSRPGRTGVEETLDVTLDVDAWTYHEPSGRDRHELGLYRRHVPQ